MPESTALARKSLTDQQIMQRIELNKQAGWGLERGTSAQLNLVYLYCQRHELLPGDDVTLYDGNVWLTVDGRVKLMRRHPEYRGFSTVPLTPLQKELWGYDVGDVVIECTIRTATWGEIKGRGKVTRDEAQGLGKRANPVARVHPVEMAEKRAIARAERMAFGTDAVLDEDDIAQQADPTPARTTIVERARRYDEIFANDDVPTREREVGDRPSAVTAPAMSGESKPSAPPAIDKPEPQVTVRSQPGQRLADLVEEAARLEVPFEDCRVSLPAPREQVVRSIEKLEDRVDARKRKLAGVLEDPEPAQVGF